MMSRSCDTSTLHQRPSAAGAHTRLVYRSHID
jgi:hypothetical protein